MHVCSLQVGEILGALAFPLPVEVRLWLGCYSRSRSRLRVLRWFLDGLCSASAFRGLGC